MKRHNSIAPLSRDHHIGLLCCWKIRQGIKKAIEIERLRVYILYFWSTHLAEHFREEEELLLSDAKDELCIQAVQEHQQLKLLVGKIESVAVIEDIMAFAVLLNAHIRFEERVVFPYLEESIKENELAWIGDRLKERHTRLMEDSFRDEFWK